MYLTDLADTLRAAGVKVVEVPGWKTRGHAPMEDIRTVVCHHTAGPKNGVAPSLPVIVHGRTGLKGPLSQIYLDREGTAHVVAAGLCWHAGLIRHIDFANKHAIGIEAEATGRDKWPADQMDAYARICAALVKKYGLDVADVRGHKEVCDPPGRKSDPNFDMGLFRRDVRNELADQRASRSKPRVGARPTLKRLLKLNSVRYMRGEDVRAVQKALGVKVDGVYGPKTRAAVVSFQKLHGLKPDGVVGRQTAHDLGLGFA